MRYCDLATPRQRSLFHSAHFALPDPSLWHRDTNLIQREGQSDSRPVPLSRPTLNKWEEDRERGEMPRSFRQLGQQSARTVDSRHMSSHDRTDTESVQSVLKPYRWKAMQRTLQVPAQ